MRPEYARLYAAHETVILLWQKFRLFLHQQGEPRLRFSQIFGLNLTDFRSKFRPPVKISICGLNFDFWPQNFGQKLKFWSKIEILVKN